MDPVGLSGSCAEGRGRHNTLAYKDVVATCVRPSARECHRLFLGSAHVLWHARAGAHWRWRDTYRSWRDEHRSWRDEHQSWRVDHGRGLGQVAAPSRHTGWLAAPAAAARAWGMRGLPRSGPRRLPALLPLRPARAERSWLAGRCDRPLLLVFLRDHCSCAWRMAGGGAPTHLAVVPSTRGRPGPHPLHALTAPLLTRPWAELALPVRSYPPDPDDRDLGLDRFILPSRLPGARVLLLDDTWTTGSRAQSAAAALKLAGATRVVVVVLGRHLNMGDDGMERIGQLLRDHRYRVGAGRMWPCPARGSRVRTCFAPLTSHQCTVDQPGTFGPNMLVAAHEILDRNVCGGSEKEG